MYMHQIERNPIYELLDAFYDHPVFYKVRNVNGMSMYAIQVPCLLLNEKRFLVVLTLQDDHIPMNAAIPLADLRWKSFMSRILKEEAFEQLPIHSYTIKQEESFMLPLSIKKRSTDVSIYDVKERKDLLVSLLHTKGNEYEYPSSGNLVSALETFQTILHWEEK